MPLGLARDSMLDLAGMVESKEAEEMIPPPPDASTPKPPPKVGESTVVRIVDNNAESSQNTDDDDNDSENPAADDPASEPSPTEIKIPKAAPSKSSYGQYSEFQKNYSDFQAASASMMVYQQQESPSILLGGKTREGGGWWCCLFPWAQQQQNAKEDDRDRQPSIIMVQEADELSATGSEAYGEKLTERDRAAVMARLRLATGSSQTGSANPNAARSTPPLPGTVTLSKKHGGLLPNGLRHANNGGDSLTPQLSFDENHDALAPRRNNPRSILKRGSILSVSAKTLSANSLASARSSENKNNSNGNAASTPRRRSLFPSYDEKPKKEHNNNVTFANMARVVTVKSHKDMASFEKGMIWWQKSDYDDFKKTGRIIAKAMLEGGSEVWLATNKSWKSGVPAEVQSAIDDAKWWHQFGHSRRGLEHIASVEEGRQRQSNVRTAIRAVIEEQQRQRLYRRVVDAEKLRMISLQYTAWARELSLAAGASDAEAVAGGFDPSRKSREFYLLKHARASGGFRSNQKLPAFMQPIARTATAMAARVSKAPRARKQSPSVLDANTSAQIRFRRQSLSKNPINGLKANGANRKSISSDTTLKTKTITTTPIRESSSTSSSKSMAKKAAGFGVSDTSMAAVLSGMGASNTNGRSDKDNNEVPEKIKRAASSASTGAASLSIANFSRALTQ